MAAIMLRSREKVRNFYIKHPFSKASTMPTPCCPLQEQVLKWLGARKTKSRADLNVKKIKISNNLNKQQRKEKIISNTR